MAGPQPPRSRLDYNDGLRPATGPGSRPALPGRPTQPASGSRPAGRQRIPTLRELAALVVDGMLTLPRNYRRGMFLDIMV